MGESQTLMYVKNKFYPYRMKFVILINVFIFFVIYNIEYILHTNLLFKVLTLILGILFVVAGFLNGILILEESKGDLQYTFFRIYYCVSFIVTIVILAFLVFLLMKVIEV